MTKKEKILLALSISDSIIGSWVEIWFVKVFIDMVSTEVVSINNIVTAGMGIFSMYIVVRRFPKPNIRHVLIAWVISYLTLFALIIGPEAFLITSSILTCGMTSLYGAFHANILEINIARRANYDNHRELLRSVSKIIGSGVAYFTILSTVSYWKIWIGIYVAFDINLIAILWFVRNGTLKYHNGHKAEPEYYI